MAKVLLPRVAQHRLSQMTSLTGCPAKIINCLRSRADLQIVIERTHEMFTLRFPLLEMKDVWSDSNYLLAHIGFNKTSQKGISLI